MSDPTEPRELFTSFEDAKKTSPYRLATIWGDIIKRPIRIPADVAEAKGLEPRTLAHEVDELAMMAALRYWTNRWMGLHIHFTLMAGASVEEVAAATGMEFAEVTSCWRLWSEGQRKLDRHRGDEFDQVDDLIRRASYRKNISSTKQGPQVRIRPASQREATGD